MAVPSEPVNRCQNQFLGLHCSQEMMGSVLWDDCFGFCPVAFSSPETLKPGLEELAEPAEQISTAGLNHTLGSPQGQREIPPTKRGWDTAQRRKLLAYSTC